MYQRGGIVSLDVGKIFPFFGPNPNSGIHLKTGLDLCFIKLELNMSKLSSPVTTAIFTIL